MERSRSKDAAKSFTSFGIEDILGLTNTSCSSSSLQPAVSNYNHAGVTLAAAARPLPIPAFGM